MKKLFLFGAVIAGGYFLFVSMSEGKAEAKIDLARSMSDEGRYDEAIQTLDDVQEWYGWTDASHQVAELRAEVVRKLRQREEEAKRQEEQRAEQEPLDEYEAEQKALEERQEDTRRRVEEARKKARLLTGGN